MYCSGDLDTKKDRIYGVPNLFTNSVVQKGDIGHKGWCRSNTMLNLQKKDKRRRSVEQSI